MTSFFGLWSSIQANESSFYTKLITIQSKNNKNTFCQQQYNQKTTEQALKKEMTRAFQCTPIDIWK